MIKQYTVDVAYTGNSHVRKYIDGKCISDVIIADYNLSGYQMALELDGFEHAFDLDEAKAEMDKAAEAYDEATKWYIFAKEHALVKEKPA